MFLKFAEAQYLILLREMGETEEQTKKRMKKRVLMSMIMGVLFLFITAVSQQYVLISVAAILAILVFKVDYFTAKREYEKFSLDRELAFGKFMQLIVPYLKKDKGKDTLYVIFSKLIPRLNPALQNALFILMNEMVANPEDIGPFENFARKCSKDDESINFMMSLFDFQNSTTDVTVIEELSETANAKLLSRVNDIIKIKNSRVQKYPVIMAICMTIVLIPFLLMYLLYIVNSSGFL